MATADTEEAKILRRQKVGADRKKPADRQPEPYVSDELKAFRKWPKR
jgi:hypothetical protein